MSVTAQPRCVCVCDPDSLTSLVGTQSQSIHPINAFDQLWLFHVLHWQVKWRRVVSTQITAADREVRQLSVWIPEHLYIFPPLPAQLENAMDDSDPRTGCKESSVIVTSISSPSILHSPPGFHGSLKLAKTYSPVTKESHDIARLETTVLPWTTIKQQFVYVSVCVCV